MTMQPTSAPAIVKRVGEYDPETNQYPAYVSIDGESEQLIGCAWSAGAADRLCDEFAFHFYADNHTPEAAAAIAVEMSEDALPNGWMRMPEGDILDTNGMRVNWSEAPVA